MALRRVGLLAVVALLLGWAAYLALLPAEPARRGFDKDQAFAHLTRQVEFGPRVPNTEGHRNTRDYLVRTLTPLADRVERQDFSRTLSGKRLGMSNVIARWGGAGGKDGVLLCAHWDTRPTADYEATPAARATPIPGANDGASGVAVLLELARLFKQKAPPVPVMMVFFDGEDFGPGVNRMFLGSSYFAANLPADVPKRGILLDMIGDRHLVIPQEAYSVQNAKDVVDEVYDIARRLGIDRYFPLGKGTAIEDDHLPLQRKGLRVIDLIDFDYGPGHSWWHTLQDTPDKCSATSLGVVGDVVSEWVYTRR
ncbi:MAG TPA: M28 family peptidase [Armatimonadota bacterium]|nr:M28 family peptidase [Armatimonadota bacterium]